MSGSNGAFYDVVGKRLNGCFFCLKIEFFNPYISLASFLWDIGKHISPRCNAAKRGIPSWAVLFAYMICTYM